MPKRPTPEQMLRDLLRQLGARGGRTRIAQLTPEERRALARKAGKASGVARRAKAKRAK